ncbi:hypothetical protein JOB18_045468, partial [Solea senegalensis]
MDVHVGDEELDVDIILRRQQTSLNITTINIKSNSHKLLSLCTKLTPQLLVLPKVYECQLYRSSEEPSSRGSSGGPVSPPPTGSPCRMDDQQIIYFYFVLGESKRKRRQAFFGVSFHAG